MKRKFKEPTTIRLNEEIDKKLTEISKMNQIPKSVLIRLGTKKVIDEFNRMFA